MSPSNAVKIVRREESLKSVEEGGVRMRLVFQNDWLEILTIELEPRNSFESSELWDSAAIHFVTEGGIVLNSSAWSILLLPGDSISLRKGAEYKIANLAGSRSVLWTLVFKNVEPDSNGGES